MGFFLLFFGSERKCGISTSELRSNFFLPIQSNRGSKDVFGLTSKIIEKSNPYIGNIGKQGFCQTIANKRAMTQCPRVHLYLVFSKNYFPKTMLSSAAESRASSNKNCNFQWKGSPKKANQHRQNILEAIHKINSIPIQLHSILEVLFILLPVCHAECCLYNSSKWCNLNGCEKGSNKT